MPRAVSVLRLSITPDNLARQIVMDGFAMQKKYPSRLVESALPVPIAKNCRGRLAAKNGVFLDPEFHSLFDKAIRLIQTSIPTPQEIPDDVELTCSCDRG